MRRRPRQARSRALVEAILEATSRVLAAEGERLTVSRVAQTAGVSFGSLYQYFASKDELLTEWHRRAWSRLHDALGRLEQEHRAEDTARLAERMASLYLTWLEAHGGPHARALSEDTARAVRAGQEAVCALLQTFATLRPQLPAATVDTLTTAVDAVARSPEPYRSRHELGAHVRRLVRGFLSAP